VIPQTPMRHLYGLLSDFSSSECHLALATEAARVPARLAARFAKSVMRFSVYENEDEPFVPEGDQRQGPANADELNAITSTDSLTVFFVQRNNGVGVVEDYNELNFNFVEREVIPTRTTGNAVYEDGTPAQRGKQVDWLLRNGADGTPIVAEIKVGNDKNLFYALVQSLMYASELVTPSQLQRLARHHPECCIDHESLDIYLVVSNFNDRSQVQNDIFEATSNLIEGLIGESDISQYVRRIACIDARLNQEGCLAFRSLFRFDRP
jgi:hypothetical protein